MDFESWASMALVHISHVPLMDPMAGPSCRNPGFPADLPRRALDRTNPGPKTGRYGKKQAGIHVENDG